MTTSKRAKVAGPKHPPIVLVEWIDTATVNARWEDREEAVRQGIALTTDPILATGFLLADREDCVVIGALLNTHNDDAAHVVGIPRSAVRAIRTLHPGLGWEPA